MTLLRHLTIVSDFNLQCTAWKLRAVDGMFFAGILVGASFFGYLSDRVGKNGSRKVIAGVTGVPPRASSCHVLICGAKWPGMHFDVDGIVILVVRSL